MDVFSSCKVYWTFVAILPAIYDVFDSSQICSTPTTSLSSW